MVYRFDEDLEFLGKLNSEDLNDLVDCITAQESIKHTNVIAKIAKKTTKTITQRRSSLISSEIYIKHCPDHKKYWKLIAEEIQRLGANSIISLFRGGGVKYREILEDVCKRMKVKFKKYLAIEAMEEKCLTKILKDYLAILSPQDVEKIADQLGIKSNNKAKKATVLTIFLTLFKAGSFESYRVVVSVFNKAVKFLFGKGLYFAGNIALIKKISSILAGPLGLSIAGTWAAFDMAGPAYRITIPAVIHISSLRKLSNKSQFMHQLKP